MTDTLTELLGKLEKLPKTDRGISWERRNWQDREQLNVYGETASLCEWVLDNSEALSSRIRSCLLDKPEAVEGVPDDIALKAEYLSLNILNVNNHEYAKEAIIHALMRERRTPADTDAAQSGGEAQRMAVADQIIGQIEERFPNWRSYRDLIDCIDCTLSDLRKDARR
ncbi:hypothetical protein [Sinorhizobium meliloti]|uniref:hypothetical protein n=1 Tax=Rhizobium meliloti TaxID=382 RepID=UPI00041A9B36|nr:hypothetical protein [Sinorhizobium meliloti]